MNYQVFSTTTHVHVDPTEVLCVSAEGEFEWHPDADRMIDEGNFTGCEAMPFILRKLRETEQAKKQEPDASGCRCAICYHWQYWTPSGMTCKNGHGGSEGINTKLYTAPPDQAAETLEATGNKIHEALRSYRLQGMCDDSGDSSHLVDLLSVPGETIASGESEIELLVDHILYYLLPPTDAIAQQKLSTLIEDAKQFDMRSLAKDIISDGDTSWAQK